MPAMPDVTTQGVPAALWRFASESCGIPSAALRLRPGTELPEPARGLLVHDRDMTSTLAAFHGSALRVDLLQQRQFEETYFREVFLRTIADGRIVEYGIIAIDLEQFTPPQQDAIRAGKAPLGALLHHFQIPFESSPIGFFSLATASLAEARRAALPGAQGHGRFNRLAKPTGESLASIMEILPGLPG